MKSRDLSELEGLPAAPGVYRFVGDDDEVLYVGKAKNLRRRIAQYRNATKLKKHRKARRIVAAAARVEWEVAPSALAAELREAELIQSLRPRFNVAGAFCFLYPYLAFRHVDGGLELLKTKRPETFIEIPLAVPFALHGCFRSRDRVEVAFDALVELFAMLGHEERAKADHRPRYATVRRVRRVPESWCTLLDAFLRGESPALLETLVLDLVARVTARSRGDEVQERLRELRRFYQLESRPLREARRLAADTELPYPLPQAARDPLFIRYRDFRKARRAARRGRAASEVEGTAS